MILPAGHSSTFTSFDWLIVVGFACLAVVVAIGGLADLRSMLRRFESRQKSSSRKDPPVRDE